MADTDLAATKPDKISAQRSAVPRKPRSIRFSESEWAGIEKEARARGMTAAELVRHAAVSMAEGKLATDSPAFPPEIPAQIERIYRGVYLLSTLKRNELIRDGQQESLAKIQKSARKSQTAILKRASTPKP